MLSKAISDQIGREFQASFFYRKAYYWFDQHLYPGTSSYMKKESDEELEHANFLEEYMMRRSTPITLPSTL